MAPNKKKKETTITKPKQSLTAYNIFFQEERQRLLESLPTAAAVVTPNPNDNNENNNDDSSDRKKSIRARRRRSATHNKISFSELGRKVGARWKELAESEKAPYRELAAADKLRYEREMKEWRTRVLVVRHHAISASPFLQAAMAGGPLQTQPADAEATMDSANKKSQQDQNEVSTRATCSSTGSASRQQDKEEALEDQKQHLDVNTQEQQENLSEFDESWTTFAPILETTKEGQEEHSGYPPQDDEGCEALDAWWEREDTTQARKFLLADSHSHYHTPSPLPWASSFHAPGPLPWASSPSHASVAWAVSAELPDYDNIGGQDQHDDHQHQEDSTLSVLGDKKLSVEPSFVVDGDHHGEKYKEHGEDDVLLLPTEEKECPPLTSKHKLNIFPTESPNRPHLFSCVTPPGTTKEEMTRRTTIETATTTINSTIAAARGSDIVSGNHQSAAMAPPALPLPRKLFSSERSVPRRVTVDVTDTLW